jgi:NAD(P)-dependent dehydrogenase (short-subunit alcohol dehydrogenase family)
MCRMPFTGAVVNIGSVHGFQNGPGLPAYAAAKGGILAFTRQLAVEYAGLGIRVNCVVPGARARAALHRLCRVHQQLVLYQWFYAISDCN